MADYSPELPEPERDTACFSKMQWFVGGVPFTTEQDAKNATQLAMRHEQNVRQHLAEVMEKIFD